MKDKGEATRMLVPKEPENPQGYANATAQRHAAELSIQGGANRRQRDRFRQLVAHCYEQHARIHQPRLKGCVVVAYV